MIIIQSLVIIAVVFLILDLFNIVNWQYYVPCTLIMSLLWLRIINSRYSKIASSMLKKYPRLLEDKIDREIFLASPSVFIPPLEFITPFAKFNFSHTVGWAFILSVIYGIISLVRADLISLFLCIIAIIDSLWGNMCNAFISRDQDNNTMRVVYRYLKSKKKKIKDVSDIELMRLTQRYEAIVDRLKNHHI